MKHTKEPWEAKNYEGFALLGGPNLESGIGEIFGEDDARRIVECVNALAGIENPNEWVEIHKTYENTRR